MLILASKSPRRQEILRQAGIPFRIQTTDIEEVRRVGETPHQYVERLAREKAESADPHEQEWALGADTIVVAAGEVLEKPVDGPDAMRMLRLLSGCDHEVLTGICLRTAARAATEVVCTTVRFCRMDDAEIAAYVASGEPMDKAGGYGIQGLASKFIERIDGCYFNVVGLPVSRVYRLWRSMGGGQLTD